MSQGKQNPFLKNTTLLASGIGMAIIISAITAGLPACKPTADTNCVEAGYAEDKYADRFITGPLPDGSGDQDAILAMDPKFTPWTPPFMVKQEPVTMSGTVTYSPHKHPYPELLGWFSTNKKNEHELGATITIYMGEEMEQHSFTKPTVLWVPANVPHGEIVHADMTRPIIYVNTFPKGKEGQGVDYENVWTLPDFTAGLPDATNTPSDGGKYGKYFIGREYGGTGSITTRHYNSG